MENPPTALKLRGPNDGELFPLDKCYRNVLLSRVSMESLKIPKPREYGVHANYRTCQRGEGKQGATDQK